MELAGYIRRIIETSSFHFFHSKATRQSVVRAYLNCFVCENVCYIVRLACIRSTWISMIILRETVMYSGDECFSHTSEKGFL